jgi:thioredoxin 1
MREVSQSEFDDVLAQTPNLVLVDFWADWCGPCKAVKPLLESMSDQYPGQVEFVAVNADENRGLMDAFGIRSLPTVLLLKPNADGPGAKVLQHAVGAQSASHYQAIIDKGLNAKPGLFSRLFGGS